MYIYVNFKFMYIISVYMYDVYYFKVQFVRIDKQKRKSYF